MKSHEIFRAGQKELWIEGRANSRLKLAYTDVGAGDPVILLHGIPTWSYLYREVIPLLARKFRVLAPDFLGHGYSDRRDCFDRSLRAQTSAILAFMDALGLERAHIVGHDTGGGVALILGIEHPGRVDRLVLSNIVAYDSWPIDDMVKLGNPQWRAKPAAEVAAFVAGGIAEGLHNRHRNTEEFRSGIVAPYADEEGKISLIRNASSLNTNHTTELIGRHREILAETLLLWGIHDPWQTIGDGERLSREIPASYLVRMEAASHWLQQDSPEEFSREVSLFLSGGLDAVRKDRAMAERIQPKN
ncbi:MAG: alpha/beta hydrolase [Parvibaculum sp.]|uniref:alpha/beta fold hydrolase n=1 Tax=Parvibaculum sp. TaxID=2024848 RepID=UPI002841C014|nr:alpha/beta hydrolase [Parvibaculum sp.]MDR3499883.1 alpha/beta hydrolase [Parvibaculum sp.]